MEKERLEMERIKAKYENSQEIEIGNDENNDDDDTLHKTSTLVIATENHDSVRYEELDIKKGDFLIVTDWNYEEKGWIYGHRKDNEEERGIFPEIFIKVYKDENKGNI